MVGSSPKTSSPTSASAMALRIPGPGLVTVSLRRSMRSIGCYALRAPPVAGDFSGKLPRTREGLCELPGVGWKTAGVVANHAFGTPALPVDTHVGRVSRRLGLTRQEDPRKVEAELTSLLPEHLWGRAHQLLIWHGRRTCESRMPHCSRCVVGDLCPRRGVKVSD